MDFNEDASSGLFYLQVPPPVVISESMNKSLPSLHSHSPNSVKSSIGSPSIFLGGMTAISNHEHTDNINKSNYHHRPALMDCSSPSFLKHQPRLHHCETACENLHEKSEGENIFWKSAWKEQKNQTERVEYELKKIEQELEDLTLSLFTEANRMVEKEKRARVEMEMKLKQVCLELDEKRLRQTNQLAIESTMQLAEFELFFVQLLDQPFQKLHKLPYMKEAQP
ncbi:hypothetical protein BC941DRAFT_467516 [Chlamydoabsidia padenii]|nr:hypothetical protein BC941DRAFT_467516 [Chlamydoabsidia padenii]